MGLTFKAVEQIERSRRRERDERLLEKIRAFIADAAADGWDVMAISEHISDESFSPLMPEATDRMLVRSWGEERIVVDLRRFRR